jgi:hypothetical protein
MAVDKCNNLTTNLVRLSKKASLESVIDGAYGIIDSITNSLIVCFKNFFFLLIFQIAIRKITQGLSSPLNAMTEFLPMDKTLNFESQNENGNYSRFFKLFD